MTIGIAFVTAVHRASLMSADHVFALRYMFLIQVCDHKAALSRVCEH